MQCFSLPSAFLPTHVSMVGAVAGAGAVIQPYREGFSAASDFQTLSLNSLDIISQLGLGLVHFSPPFIEMVLREEGIPTGKLRAADLGWPHSLPPASCVSLDNSIQLSKP